MVHFNIFHILIQLFSSLQRNKEREIQASVQAATMMVIAIERNQALLIEEIERKQEVAEKRAEELLKEISQEINELQKRCSELHLLEHTENPVQLQQVRISIYV